MLPVPYIKEAVADSDTVASRHVGSMLKYSRYPKSNHRACLAFYPRDAMLARVIAIKTCLSVCPYVTSCRYCVKTKKASENGSRYG